MNNISLPHVFGRELSALVGGLNSLTNTTPTREEVQRVEQLLDVITEYLDPQDNEVVHNIRGLTNCLIANFRTCHRNQLFGPTDSLWLVF